MLYTIVPEEMIFAEEDGEASPARMLLWNRGRASVQVEPVGGGFCRVISVFSTNPQDYLDPSLAPGRLVWLADDGLNTG